MLSTNINKILAFVIFAAVAVVSACSYFVAQEPPVFDEAASDFQAAVVVGKLESKEITESSGLIVSRCEGDVLWTHNDSGDGPYLFAFNRAGAHLGTWQVTGAKNVDWEDLATSKDAGGNCSLYIGEIGNSKDGQRREHIVYKIAEPKIDETNRQTAKENATQTEPAVRLTFSYPDRRRNAETLLVEPTTGSIYIVTKEPSEPAAVYKLNPVFEASKQIAIKITDLTVPAIPYGMLTGGSVSSDGKRLVLCDYFAAYEFELPAGSTSFEDIWKQKPSVVSLGKRKQGESIAYSPDGNSIFATTEGANSPLIEVVRK